MVTAGDVGSNSNWENLSIYYANLSPVYLCSSLFTILALFFTWWYSTRIPKAYKIGHKGKDGRDDSSIKTQEGFHTTVGASKEENNSKNRVPPNVQDALNHLSSNKDDTSMMSHIKTIRQTEIEKQLTAGLSEEQLMDERKMQATQLAAIYKLLKEKEDKFQIRSMDELQEQMRLYKS